MNSISNGSYYNLLKALPSMGAGKRAVPSASNPPGPAPTVAIAEQLDKYLKRLGDNAQALAKLNAMPPAEDKKATAAARVRQLKEQLRMLMSMLMMGNPKANVRQIAALARELASAAREYASAGGGAAPQGQVPQIQTPAIATTDNATALSATSNNTAALVAGATESMKDAEPDAKADSAGNAGGIREYQDSQASQGNDETKNKFDGIGAKSAAGDADREFLREVRELATKLKALAKQQEQRLHREGERSADNELSDINKALNEIEKATADIAQASAESATAISVFA